MSHEDDYLLKDDYGRRFGLKSVDTSFCTLPLTENQTLSFGKTEFTVISTPGHTPGGVCLYDAADKALFTGDTLFAGCIGRTDLPGGDYDQLIVGIMEKLLVLSADVTVFPGHGGTSSIADERTHNPFLQPFNEPDTDQIDWDADGIELRGTDL